MAADAFAHQTQKMPQDGNKAIDRKALAIPFALVGVLFAGVLITARWGLAAEITWWVLFVIGLQAWGLQQVRKARRKIRAEIESCGVTIVEMKSRSFRLGPFSMLNTSRTQSVYRVVVRESTGRERLVWARSGRKWFWNPPTVDLKWEEVPAQ